jgi:uncharacterized protein YcfJ
MSKLLAVIGAAVGGAIGFWMRPSNVFLGKLDFMTTLTRGSNLKGLDELLKSQAEASSNMLIGGVVIGAIIGFLIGKALIKKPKTTPS